ncbi:siderophore-interacting protein [Yoonia maritima]|uniref:siderophore-interacting protein n=1 Tax=Yoonia maritima TaxID=1435347 RepID=UPI000D0F6B67|nr:siderophore-interacting protein [Yoonia maritima]
MNTTAPQLSDAFRLAELVSIDRPFPSFFRVTMRAPDLQRYTEGGMHFRLLLPPKGRTPVWPYIDETGRARFPTGDDQLHNPVYTFVSVDVVAQQFTFDVYIHEGGRITEWMRNARLGDTIGINGPGGGTMPVADKIIMAGDETALPAIRRILAASAADVTGAAYIEVGAAEDVQDLKKPAGVDLRWLIRGRDVGSVQALIDNHSNLSADNPPFVWCGAEKSQVQKARAHFRDTLGIGTDHSYLSGYWRQAKPTVT